MDVTLTVVFNIALHVLVAATVAGGTAVFRRGSRGRRVLWVSAARTLCRAVPLAATCVAVAAFLGGAGVAGTAGIVNVVWEPVPMLVPGLATLVGAWGTGGMLLTLAAGGTERRGRLPAARRRVGFGGRAAFLGAAGQVVFWGATFFAQPAAVQRALVAAGELAGQAGLGAMLLGAGGFVALLAGLTGKPRPSGPAGALLYIGGYALLVGAALALVN